MMGKKTVLCTRKKMSSYCKIVINLSRLFDLPFLPRPYDIDPVSNGTFEASYLCMCYLCMYHSLRLRLRGIGGRALCYILEDRVLENCHDPLRLICRPSYRARRSNIMQVQ